MCVCTVRFAHGATAGHYRYLHANHVRGASCQTAVAKAQLLHVQSPTQPPGVEVPQAGGVLVLHHVAQRAALGVPRGLWRVGGQGQGGDRKGVGRA